MLSFRVLDDLVGTQDIADLMDTRHTPATHASWPVRKSQRAVVVDQVLPDGHGVAPAAERVDDQLAVGLARARVRRSTGSFRGDGCGVVRALAGRRGPRRVGGHLRRKGRLCRASGRPATAPHLQAGRLQVAAGGLAPDPGGLFDLSQRPAEASQRENLLSFLFGQDVAHAGQERRVPGRFARQGQATPDLSRASGIRLTACDTPSRPCVGSSTRKCLADSADGETAVVHFCDSRRDQLADRGLGGSAKLDLKRNLSRGWQPERRGSRSGQSKGE